MVVAKEEIGALADIIVTIVRTWLSLRTRDQSSGLPSDFLRRPTPPRTMMSSPSAGI
jgi:hypothetical protein